MPIVGNFIKNYYLSIFLLLLSNLLAEDEDILISIDISKEHIKHPYIKNKLDKLSKTIEKKGCFINSIKELKIFPENIFVIISIGEQTGSLGKAMGLSYRYLFEQTNYRVHKILSWTGPALIIIMGLLVLCIVLALVVPLYDNISAVV